MTTTAATHMFTSLQTLLLGLEDVTCCLHDLAVSASQLGPGLSSSVTVRSDTGWWTVASSDKWADQLDEPQYTATARPLSWRL